MPLGSVIALLTAPNSDGTLPNSNGIWVLSAGQNVVGYGTVPDLRGSFLRGINLAISGKNANNLDSIGRNAGSFQNDTIKSHTHEYRIRFIGNYVAGGTTKTGLEGDAFYTSEPFGGSETRPKNIAVYWYVKVK